MKRRATAVWRGTGLEGSGTLTGKSGVLNETPYSTKVRFQNEDGTEGTNPEELVAAAHAGCFNMALSFQLVAAGFTADELNTEAVVTIEKQDEGGFAITGISLDLKGKVPGISKEQFEELANGAKVNCPISKALSAVPIELAIELN